MLVKSLLQRVFALTLRPFGLNMLSRDATARLLAPYAVGKFEQHQTPLPAVMNGSEKQIFRQRIVADNEVHVWHYSSGSAATQFTYGSIKAGTNVLCTDFGHSGVVKALLHRKQRDRRNAEVLIAPWSHFIDGVSFGGYYDFVVLVAAKLCRMKRFLSPETFAAATVAYPFFGGAYEQEYLSLIGIAPGNVVDSGRVKLFAKQVVLADSGDWFYPNVDDILALKNEIEARLSPQRTRNDRIYISRAGRRRVTNETELIRLLERFDFKVIEDRPRTVAEQVDIYKNASLIIGPHGASFTNVIWCEPGAHLVELFSPDYMPDFFQYLANVSGVAYSAFYDGEPQTGQHVSETLLRDMTAPLATLQVFLAALPPVS